MGQILIRQTGGKSKEKEPNDYYGWPTYWTGTIAAGPVPLGGMVGVPVLTEEEPRPDMEAEPQTHLRSTREVIGYRIQAADGEIGHVQDFLIDDDTWAIRYMVVDTRNRWPGKEVLVAPQWIDRVRWEDEKVYVDLNRERIRSSPEFDAVISVNRDYENRLYEHYKRRKYWS